MINAQPDSNVEASSNAVMVSKQIDFLLYLQIQFEGKDVKALLDTGSTTTIVSKHFCKANNISIPPCKFSREVTLADGTKIAMREWQDAKTTLDKYMSIKGDVLISKSKTYEMLFGLNTCISIGANINQDFLRYCVDINGKERFGKIPLIRRPLMKDSK